MPSESRAELMLSVHRAAPQQWGYGEEGVSRDTHAAKPTVQPKQQALPERSLTSRQDKMKFTASSGVKTLKRPSQASKMNLQHGEEIQVGFNSQLYRRPATKVKQRLVQLLKG